MALTYRNDVGCMWLNAITKQSLRDHVVKATTSPRTDGLTPYTQNKAMPNGRLGLSSNVLVTRPQINV